MSNCETTRQNRRNGLVFNTPGTRYTPVNPYLQGFTQQQLDMRRKAEILQYNKTSNGKPTKKQAWGTLVRGATQRKQYTSYYLKNLQDGLLDPEQICPNDKFIPTSSKNAGVPGPEITLYYDPTVPLYNYNSMQIAYGTQNSDEQLQPKWLLNYETNVTDNNLQKIFTLNIRPSIDEPVYVFSFTTSVGLYISGNTTQPDGVFSMGIPLNNLSVIVTYGGQTVTLPYAPTVSYSPHFVQNISGDILSTPATFAGRVYMGDLTFSNIWLNTAPNTTYDVYIDYIPSYEVNNIDNTSVYIITNFGSTADKLQEVELSFSSPASTDAVTTFSLTGAAR